MTFLNVTFDTQCVDVNEFKTLLQDGQVLHAVGILNIRWDDSSALELARDAELLGVTWDVVYDDTASSLELTIWYPFVGVNSIQQRVNLMDCIEAYDLQCNH